MSKYCQRYIDDYPGIRAECERHINSKRPCEDCPNRDIRQEVVDLRNKAKERAKAIAYRRKMGQ